MDRTGHSSMIAAAAAAVVVEVVVVLHCIGHWEGVFHILEHRVVVLVDFVALQYYLIAATAHLDYKLDICHFHLVDCYRQLHHEIVSALTRLVLGDVGTFHRATGRPGVSVSFVPKIQKRK